MPPPMDDEPNWRERRRALEYWLISALVAGAFVAGLFSAMKHLANYELVGNL